MGNTIAATETICADDGICEFVPSPGALSMYNGMSPEGSWRLCVGDSSASAVDTLEEVAFIITTQ